MLNLEGPSQNMDSTDSRSLFWVNSWLTDKLTERSYIYILNNVFMS